nr:uncharacterized protein LOC127299523 isoform X2 [Lolium perenne]
MEAGKGKIPEHENLVDEEKAEIEAAAQEWWNITQSRIELMRRLGEPVSLFYPKKPVDARILLNRKSNCDHIDIGSGSVDMKELLAKEELIWSTAMDYRKAKNMVYKYDLVPNSMTMYPVMFENHTWYHCNLLGHNNEVPSTGGDLGQQCFFVEVNINQGFNYNVVACIALDDDTDNNVCKMCPPNFGVLHPRKGGFICGSQEGQLLRHYINVY